MQLKVTVLIELHQLETDQYTQQWYVVCVLFSFFFFLRFSSSALLQLWHDQMTLIFLNAHTHVNCDRTFTRQCFMYDGWWHTIACGSEGLHGGVLMMEATSCGS